MTRDVILTDQSPAPLPVFSQAIRAGDTVYVSGQVGMVPGATGLVDNTVAAQTEQTLRNIQAILEAAGTDMAHVVKCTVLLADIATFGEMNAVYAKFFPHNPPARAAFAVRDLPVGALVEIECIAVLP